MQKSHVDIIMYLFYLNENHCTYTKNCDYKNNIAIHIAGKVLRYIDASKNRATRRSTCISADLACDMHQCRSDVWSVDSSAAVCDINSFYVLVFYNNISE